MEHKFKVGDVVVTHYFSNSKDGEIRFHKDMMDLLGKAGVIEGLLYNGGYLVHGWNWPASALSLGIKDVKNGDEVEFSYDGKQWFSGLYVGRSRSKGHVVEISIGIVNCSYCRHPKPIMQKWNVWRSGNGKPVLLEDGYVTHGNIVHTFELPK